MGPALFAILLLVIAAVVFLAWRGLKIVQQSETMVVERLGRYARGAGLSLAATPELTAAVEAALSASDDTFEVARVREGLAGEVGPHLDASLPRTAPGPLSALRRATLFWIRTAAASAPPLPPLPGPQVRTRYRPTAWVDPSGTEHSPEALSGAPVVALAGLARPGREVVSLR